MDEKRIPNFLLFNSDEGSALLNLNQIRTVDQIRDGHCRIFFSETYIVELHGEGATRLLAVLYAHATGLDGTPVAEALAKMNKGTKSE
jgi:hypothetical protein